MISRLEINGLPLLRKLLLADSAAGPSSWETTPGEKPACWRPFAFLLRLRIPAHSPDRTSGLPRKTILRHPGRTSGANRAHPVGAGRSGPPRQPEPRKDQRSYLADSYPVVWMGNDDLSLVQAGADARRKYMDFLGSQWHPGYILALFSYRRALKTRNYLLKHRHRDKLQLDAYTRQLALHRHGTEKPARPSAGAPGAPYRPGLPQYRRKAGTGLHRLPRLGGRRPV